MTGKSNETNNPINDTESAQIKQVNNNNNNNNNDNNTETHTHT